MKIAIVTGASSGMGKEFVRQIERFYRELDEIWVMPAVKRNWKRSRKATRPISGSLQGTWKRIWYTSR